MSSAFPSITTQVLDQFVTKLNTVQKIISETNKKSFIDGLPIVIEIKPNSYIQLCSINTNSPEAGDVNNVQTENIMSDIWGNSGSIVYNNNYFWLLDPTNPQQKTGKCAVRHVSTLVNSGVQLTSANIKSNPANYIVYNNDPLFGAGGGKTWLVMDPRTTDESYRGYIQNVDTSDSSLVLEKLFSEADVKTIFSYMKDSTYEVYLSNDGTLQVFKRSNDKNELIMEVRNPLYSAQKKSTFLAGTLIASLDKNTYLSTNGFFILYMNPAENYITIRLNIMNTSNFLQYRTVKSLSEEQMKGMYETYCTATRYSSTPGDWLDPRCTCVMLDDNILVLNGGAPGISTVSSYVRSHSPCMMKSCFSNVNDSPGTYPYYVRSTSGCSKEISICRETFDIRNSKIGNINMQSCNSRKEVLCTATNNKCMVGEACDSSTQLCRRTCSADVRCPVGYTCNSVSGLSDQVCIPNPTVTDPSSSSPSSTNGNTTVTTASQSSSNNSSNQQSNTMVIVFVVLIVVTIIGFVLYNKYNIKSGSTAAIPSNPNADE